MWRNYVAGEDLPKPLEDSGPCEKTSAASWTNTQRQPPGAAGWLWSTSQGGHDFTQAWDGVGIFDSHELQHLFWYANSSKFSSGNALYKTSFAIVETGGFVFF